MDFDFSRFEIETGTGAVFLCLVFVCLFLEAGAIQTEVAAGTRAALAEQPLFWVGVRSRGQRVTLTGAAPDQGTRQRAVQVARAAPGVVAVEDRLTVVGDLGACQQSVDDYLGARPVTFKAGKSELSGAGLATLTELAPIIRRCGATYEVASHVDAEGDSAMNQILTQRRAEAVVRQLVQVGVPPAQLRAAGYGETEPLADNASSVGRSTNRRLEFRIIGGPA
jgi:outer membrane protein OmpA-like peptidoglycan-associated protein